MWFELYLLASLAILCVNVVLLSSVPRIVRKVIQEELRRLFEGEYKPRD